MNKARRKTANEIRDRIEEANTTIEALMNELGALRDEEQEAFDNMSEGLQQSETGQNIEAAADALTNAHDALDEIDQILTASMEYIDEAVGG